MDGEAVLAEPKDIIISSGHKNFHMLFTAAELAKRGRLATLIAGGYPRPFERKILKPWAQNRKVARFLGRREAVPDDMIQQSRVSEVLSSTGPILARGLRLPRINDDIQAIAFDKYARNACKAIQSAASQGATTYHFRAGFGQSSIAVARKAGMRIICDHSIVHPAMLAPLINLNGVFPDSRPEEVDGFWRKVQDDIDSADLVLVNSDFVAETFSFMGTDPDRVAVVYQGVEDKFISRLPKQRDYYAPDDTRPIRLLFAGGIGARKGVDEIAAALAADAAAHLELHMAGSLSSEARNRYATLLADRRVTYHGVLSQDDLAELMSWSDVFLFPSRAEGSARVVFEAMAAGCAVIVTKNAGSVAQDGVSGFVVPVNDAPALSDAISTALSEPVKMSEMGRANHDLILSCYRQKNYGDALERVYGVESKKSEPRKC